jgi:hypothetical protein
MPMPEAAIYKHSQSLSWKDEVWLAKKLRISPPPGDPACLQQLNQPQFGVAVSKAADA